jgi:hypothetical protein
MVKDVLLVPRHGRTTRA